MHSNSARQRALLLCLSVQACVLSQLQGRLSCAVCLCQRVCSYRCKATCSLDLSVCASVCALTVAKQLLVTLYGCGGVCGRHVCAACLHAIQKLPASCSVCLCRRVWQACLSCKITLPSRTTCETSWCRPSPSLVRTTLICLLTRQQQQERSVFQPGLCPGLTLFTSSIFFTLYIFTLYA